MPPVVVDLDSDALIVTDLQADFMPGGALPVAGGDLIAAPIGALARRFRLVVATQDFHPPGHVSFASAHPGRRPLDQIPLHGGRQVLWPDHCVAGTPGAALHPALPDAAVTLLLRKGTDRAVDSYSAFLDNGGPDRPRSDTGLTAWLRARGAIRLFVVGLARDYCVRSTALDGAARGFTVFVVDDLTRAVNQGRGAEVDRELEARGVRLITSGSLRFGSA